MATLAETKTRIIAELDRDDMSGGGELETVLTSAIDRAIEFHADELFWFNRKTATVATAAGSPTVSLPSGMRLATFISCDQAPLGQVALSEIEHRTTSGRPAAWAENEGAIQLHPVPDGSYTLKVSGIEELGTPASAASNAWTTTALDLIVETAKKFLCRGVLRDAEGAAFAAEAEQEHLAKLRRESRRRGQVLPTTDLPASPAFNIITG